MEDYINNIPNAYQVYKNIFSSQQFIRNESQEFVTKLYKFSIDIQFKEKKFKCVSDSKSRLIEAKDDCASRTIRILYKNNIYVENE